jgi:aspartyl protease family protein
MNVPLSQKRIGKTMLAIFWVAVIAGLTAVFGNWEKQKHNPNTSPQSQHYGDQVRVTLERNPLGHYVASGFINDHDATFLLDTGATLVAVPEKLAITFKLKKGRSHRINTANGTATAYQTEIENLKIGAIELRHVPASITPSMRGDEILLGMSALKHINFSQNGKFLTLSQKTY